MTAINTTLVTEAYLGLYDPATHYGEGDGSIFGHIRISRTRQIGLWLMKRVTGAFRAGIDAVTRDGKDDESIIGLICFRHNLRIK